MHESSVLAPKAENTLRHLHHAIDRKRFPPAAREFKQDPAKLIAVRRHSQ
jgi:hypothetical protein